MTENTASTTDFDIHEPDSTDEEVGFLLSSQQERLWSAFGEAVPRSQCLLDLLDAPEGDEIRRALQRAVDRHEILRTAFVRPAGLRAPLQVVRDRGTVCWGAADLGGLSDSDQQRRVAEILRAQIDAPVDLERGPLLRAMLLTRADHRLLALTAPAIALDARSLELLAQEALRAAAAGDPGSPAGEPPQEEPLQYGDYAAWQHEQRELEDGAGPAAAADARDAPITALPLAGAATAPASDPRLEVPVAVDREAAARIERMGAEPRDAWLALWGVLLARLSGGTRVTVDVRVDGRAQEELVGALGPFARHLPVTVEIAPGASFEDVLATVARARGAAEEGQERQAPATRPRTLVGFSFATDDAEPFELAGLRAVAIGSSDPDDLHQASLRVRSRAGGPELVLSCDREAVARAEAERLAGQLETLIEAVAGSGSAAVAHLEILSPSQRAHLLEELSGASGSASAALGCVHWRFEDLAARTPDAPAVALGGERLSYAQLNERANRLAHALRARGVGSGSTVTLLLDRSPELVVAVLGVLKAGGAYLPLNPDHPTERLAFQVRDAASSLVLTQGSLAPRAAALETSVLRLDEPLDSESAENPQRRNDPGDVVYVIYTSGSTGVPKGVEVTHAGLASYVAAITDRLALSGEEPLRFGVLTTMSTDLGNTTIFSALLSGGCLELIPVEAAMDGEAFAAHLGGRPLDVMKITPSHLSALLASAERGVLPLRWLVLGGEAAPWPLIEQVRALERCAIVNHYGPTETTVGALTYEVGGRHGEAGSAATVPIGRPLAGTEIYIVDEQLQPVPLGSPGELLIGGAGLARGYRGRPEQTAERFVAHPFSSDPRARVYRTGDVVRFLAEGSVEFLGRADDQVKIRGFRVEPAEIETVLAGHPAVSRIAVVMREEAPGDRRLVAYLVGEAELDSLRALARERLPDYMIPSAFVRLDALPLTPNGKLDRLALPAPDAAGSASREYLAPSTEIEERLAAIWAEALGIERVGVRDDFFELGGHSLLATQVIARIRRAYDVQLPLHSLFVAPCIADLALEVAAALEPTEQDDAELAALLEDLEGLTDEEAERLLGLETAVSEEQPAAGPE